MSVRAAVISQIRQVAEENGLSLPSLTDNLVLLESGLDSLGIAILVARLEDALGIDPFTEFASDDMAYPVTLGAFVEVYQRAADSHALDQQRAG
jgi:acyl carrier protein